MDELLDIVDENDTVIGQKERSQVCADNIYRVAALWVTSPDGMVLLAQRSLDKKNAPGKWGPAVAGTVASGETYQETILRETEEELGIVVNDRDIRPWQKVRIEGENNFFSQWFRLKLDKQTVFTPDPNEVAQVRWFSLPELRASLIATPELFVPSAASWRSKGLLEDT